MKMTYITFPASGQKAGIDSVLYAVVKHVLGKFPQQVIRQYFVDTNDKMRSIYHNALSTYNGNTAMNNDFQEMLKIPRPHLFVGYQLDSGFETTDTGLGETQPYIFPNSFYQQNSMQNQHPVLVDNGRRITVATSNLRIKSTAEFVITCQNKEEQLTIYNYVLNMLKMYYTMPLIGIKASFIVPDYLITFIKDILYGEKTPLKDVHDDFVEYIKRCSDGFIKNVYKNGKEDQEYFEMTWLYNRIDFRMSGKPQIDEGSKEDEAPDNFTVRFPAVIEFYIPTNYTVRAPELIPSGVGHVFEIPDALKLDSIVNKDVMDHIQTISKVEEDNLMRHPHLDEDGWEKVYSTEFALSSQEDSFNISDVLSEEKSILKILNNLSTEERKKCVLFQLYEGERILDEGKYCDIDYASGDIMIHQGDCLQVHTLEVYLKAEEIEKVIKSRGK